MTDNIEISKEEAIEKISIYKRRFRTSCISIIICIKLLVLNRVVDSFHVGNIAPIIVLVFSVLAAVGFYGQYRTLEQQYF